MNVPYHKMNLLLKDRRRASIEFLTEENCIFVIKLRFGIIDVAGVS